MGLIRERFVANQNLQMYVLLKNAGKTYRHRVKRGLGSYIVRVVQ